MKIIKSSTSKNIESKYGNFDLIVDENYEIKSFVDYESKLLVVEESLILEEGNQTNETSYYIIDPVKAKCLSFDEYKEYFNYEPQTIISKDREFKLEFQRKYDTVKGIDYRVQKLTHLKSGKIFSDGREAAFEETEFRAPLQRYTDCLRAAEEERKNIVRIDLEKHNQIAKEKLRDNDVIIRFYNSSNIFELIFQEKKYCLYKKEGTSWNPWKYEPPTKKEIVFTNIEEFWKYFSEDENWFKTNTAFRIASERGLKENLLAKYIIDSGNEIRRIRNYTQKEHDKLKDWQGIVSSRNIAITEIKQYCSNCKEQVRYNPRYSTYICRNCNQLITDKSGKRVTYYNTELLGYGCQGYYINTEPKKKYNSNTCYIEEKEFYAEEVRFGGIVIRKKE